MAKPNTKTPRTDTHLEELDAETLSLIVGGAGEPFVDSPLPNEPEGPLLA
jgi:hypothetical protein